MIGVLPKALVVNGISYPIYSDYRVALLIFDMCDDDDISDKYKTYGCLQLLLEDYTQIPQKDLQEAAEKAKWFLDGGDMSKSKEYPKPIISWEQDESIMFPALNKVAGKEIREVEYMHWWTFLGLFNDIGEGLFSQVINIRAKQAKGKKLEKWEREYWNSNRAICALRTKLSEEEQAEKDRIDALLG